MRVPILTGPEAELCLFSLDVEDWFHRLDLSTAPPFLRWRSLSPRVERNMRLLFDLFSEYEVHVTCFFLGWVAEHYPALVHEALARGHEVASHGYAHQLVHDLTPAQFYTDVRRAKEILEGISGRAVAGYRAPGCSVSSRTPWFFDKLAEAGYRYDSSVFPEREHGGFLSATRVPYEVATPSGTLLEFPMTVAPMLGRQMRFGGGYLRALPYALTRNMARRVLRDGRPVVFYIHPHEIDPRQPRLEMSALRNFRTYVNLDATVAKVRRVLTDFRVTSIERYLSRRTLLGLPMPLSPPRQASTHGRSTESN